MAGVLIAWYVFAPRGAAAHDLGVVRVRLVEAPQSQYLLEVKLPPIPGFERLVPTLPARCRFSGAPAVQRRDGSIDMRLVFDCAGSPLTPEDVLHFPWPNQGAFVATQFRSGTTGGRFFEATELGVSVTLDTLVAEQHGILGTARRYLLLGIEHILTGWDHLAFVLTLCLIASGWRLVRLVSAFTAGHSLTLALASLGVVHVALAPTEACIALSIAFVARRAAYGIPATRQDAALVFGFGLLHGLGFATALAESGIGASEFLLGLVSFNFGVEVGQLMFVAVVVGIAALGRLVPAPRRPIFSVATAYSVGILGVFWTLQRIFDF
jgi:hydrogenase/urease accessory protein HupE